MNRQRRGQRGGFALFLLANELVRTASSVGIPPITLATIVGQIVVYMRLIPLPWSAPYEVCMSVNDIWSRGKWLRLILAQVEHGDDWHLYYNMVSFLSKGRTLERMKFGSKKFAALLSMLTVMTGIMYVVLSKLLAEILQDDSYLYSCAVGFSGVLFALKVLTTHYWDTYEHSSYIYMLGMLPIHPKHAVWAELVMIQLISPNASFVGHLAGISVGLLYVHGPLKPISDLVFSILFDPVTTTRGTFRQNRSSTTGRTTGYSTSSASQSRTTYANYVPPGMDEEEQIRRATEESLRAQRHDPPPQRMYPEASPSAPPYPMEDSPHPLDDPPYPTREPPYSTNTRPVATSQSPGQPEADREFLRRVWTQRFAN